MIGVIILKVVKITNAKKQLGDAVGFCGKIAMVNAGYTVLCYNFSLFYRQKMLDFRRQTKTILDY
jgi:hypothetical protein